MTGAMTYVLKNDLYWPDGRLWKAAGTTVGLYDRINGKLVTDLDNWAAPPPPTAPTGLVHGTDEAPPGWMWKETVDEPGRGRTPISTWTLVVDPAAPVTPPADKWALTADEQAKKDAMAAYVAKQKAQRKAAEQQQKVTTMIGAPVRPPIRTSPAAGAMPKQWMPKGMAQWGKGKGGGRNI